LNLKVTFLSIFIFLVLGMVPWSCWLFSGWFKCG